VASGVDGMSVNPPDGGFQSYPPQSQLPPSVTVVVNNPPQSLPQVQRGAQDPYATATAYRPNTDRFIGEALHPALENALATDPADRSRYLPSVVYPSGTPGYSTSYNGVMSTDAPNPNIPHDPTEAGSR
jgi:hypothetical protein